MKNSLKLVFISGITVVLSACHHFISEEDRIKDHRMKCEMYGFLPGSEQFALCVQRRENRYLNEKPAVAQPEEKEISKVERKKVRQQSRKHYNAIENNTVNPAAAVSNQRREQHPQKFHHHKETYAPHTHQSSIDKAADEARHKEEHMKRQQEAEKKRQEQEQKKQDEKKHREAVKAMEDNIGQRVEVPETTPAGIGAQVPVTQPAPSEATTSSGTKAS